LIVRLQSFTRGSRFGQRLFIGLTRILGAEVDDVGKAVMRRPVFFGKPFLQLAQRALRGRSAWTVGERELFGAVVSRANECPFCADTHSAIAAQEMGWDALTAWDDERLGPRLSAVCRFVEKLTREPDAIGADDLARARAAGVDDAALLEAVYVACLFNVINRIANALEFTHASETSRLRGAAVLRRLGYRLPSVLFREEHL
jgi:uncharacterized peroxidase-related enzyme